MEQLQSALDCYKKTAEAYAEKFFDELSGKPVDQLLLQRFAEENGPKGQIADLGCGPGQTTRFLRETGVEQIVGIDLSPRMIEVAKSRNPEIPFETGNMLALGYPSDHFGGVIAFYAIVHLTNAELSRAMREIHRVLKAGGQFLFSFHVGEEVNHLDEWLDQSVDIDFRFFLVDPVLRGAEEAGFTVKAVQVREPYVGKEYPSQRAYVIVEK